MLYQQLTPVNSFKMMAYFQITEILIKNIIHYFS